MQFLYLYAEKLCIKQFAFGAKIIRISYKSTRLIILVE